MLRFLFTRRWLGLLLAVLVVSVTCVELGLWQFRRYSERSNANHVTESNLSADPVPVDQVMGTDQPPAESDQWRVVTATGTYDTAHQLAVLYRTRDGQPGIDVVVPLVTGSGAGLVVDRGWVQTPGNGNQTPDLPPPPPGQVTITGWVRINAGSGSETEISDGSMRAISSEAIRTTVPYDLYDGFVDLTSESLAATPAPARAATPDLGSGPHFFYGVQWFFFALLAFGFWCYFAWSEYEAQRRQARLDETLPASQASGDPSVDRQHGAGDVARGG